MLYMAMSAGCIAVTNDTIFTRSLINKNIGLFYEDIDSLVKHCNTVMESCDSFYPNQANELIQKRFSISNIDLWDEIFQQTSNMIYIRK